MYNYTTEKCQKGLLAKTDTPKVRYLFKRSSKLIFPESFLMLNIWKVERKIHFYQLFKSFGCSTTVTFHRLRLKQLYE